MRGASTVGTVDVVCGEVVQVHIRDVAVGPYGKPGIGKIAPIAQMGYYDYAVIRETSKCAFRAYRKLLLMGSKGPQSGVERTDKPPL